MENYTAQLYLTDRSLKAQIYNYTLMAVPLSRKVSDKQGLQL
jgi:hypothetical protein